MSALSALVLAGVAFASGPPTDDWVNGGGLPDDRPMPIINGEDADEAKYPMTGAVLVEVTMGGFGQVTMLVCTSTLIAPDTILLAAHCVDPETLSMMTYGMAQEADAFYWTQEADLSEYNTSFDLPPPEDAIRIDGSNVRWHENFDLNGMDLGVAQNYDVALGFLDEPATGVPYAYLPTVDEATQIVEGMDVDVVGWGMTGPSQNAPSGEKQWGTSYIAELGTHEMQIGAEEDDVRKCHGDSGGPSYVRVQTDALESLRVIGVTSHAYDMTDCNEKGGVDTRVDAYLGWISQEMEAACADGTRVWCEQAGIPVLPYDVDEDGILDHEDPKIGKACGCAQDAGAVNGALALAIAGLVIGRRRRS